MNRAREHAKTRPFGVVAFLLITLWANAATAQYSMVDYFPLPIGGTWNYRLSLDGSTVTAQVLGTANVNGAIVTEVDNGGGSVLSYTNDTSGLRLHRIETNLPSSTVTFSTPIVQANASANVGDAINSAGTATFFVPGTGSFPISYSATSTINTLEQVTVPAGTYAALRMGFTFTLTGTVDGTPINDTVTSVLWLAENVGIVRDDEGVGGVLELTSTTVGPPGLLPPDFQGDFHDIGFFQPSRFHIRDVNNDTNLDIVTVNRQANRQISTILGDGLGDFANPISRMSGSCSTCNRGDFVAGDFNKDGFQDLAVVMREQSSVGVHLGDGAGNFGNSTFFLYRINGQLGGSNPTDITTGDVDNDGNMDLVTVNFSSGDASVLLGDGLGNFGTVQLFPTGFPNAVELADVNEDNNLDLVVVRPSDDDVIVLFGVGNGTFANPQSFSVGDFPQDLAVGDVNNDGHLDVVTTNAITDNISVLLGNGFGGFAQAVNFSQQCPQFASCYLQSVALGDLNNDGNLDILATDRETDEILILMGNGLGSFGQATNVNTDTCSLVSGCPVSEVKTADLNGDGRLDVAVTYSNTKSVLVLTQLATDTDGDGVPDDEDAFPNDPSEWSDNDNDGIGDNADLDDDNDGVPDDEDAFPLDPSEWDDTDGDGIGNNADTDDDGDTMPDAYEIANGLDPLDAADADIDADGDGFTNLEEFQAGTDPQDAEDSPGAKKVPVAITILLGDDEVQ